MAGSGPMEAFYHQKVFARLKRDGIHSWLVVPNEAVLWAGPYLADLAYHLGSGGSVLIPSAGGAYLKLQGRPLSRIARCSGPAWITRTTRSTTSSGPCWPNAPEAR
jgi:hypothetical protein